jgi:hypothetical protein
VPTGGRSRSISGRSQQNFGASLKCLSQRYTTKKGDNCTCARDSIRAATIQFWRVSTSRHSPLLCFARTVLPLKYHTGYKVALSSAHVCRPRVPNCTAYCSVRLKGGIKSI